MYIIPRSAEGATVAPGDVDAVKQDGNDLRAGDGAVTKKHVEDLAEVKTADTTAFRAILQNDRKKIIKAVMSSAIVAAPGPDTGEMLVAYPQTTAHSIEVAPEQMTMQMRAYLGAKVRAPSPPQPALLHAHACAGLQRCQLHPHSSRPLRDGPHDD